MPDFNCASDISINTVNILYWRENVRTLPRELFHSFIDKKDISAISFPHYLIFYESQGGHKIMSPHKYSVMDFRLAELRHSRFIP